MELTEQEMLEYIVGYLIENPGSTAKFDADLGIMYIHNADGSDENEIRMH